VSLEVTVRDKHYDSGTDLDSTPELPCSLTDAPVGLSDPQFVAKKCRMLDAVNCLRVMG